MTQGKRTYGTGGIRRRANGRWEASLSLGVVQGRRRRLVAYGRTRADAQAALGRKIKDYEAGSIPPNDQLTVHQLFAIWLRDVVAALSPTTRRSYAMNAQRITRALGEVKLQHLRAGDLQALYAALRRQGLAANTIRSTHLVASAALGWAERMEYIARSPTRRVHAPRYEPSRRRTFTAAEAQAVMAQAKGDRLAAYWWLLITTGARPGELLSLRWDDVDLERGVFLIRASKTAAGKRLNPICAPAGRALQALQAEQPTPRPVYVFPGGQGNGHMKEETVRAAWYRLLDQAGVPRTWMYTGGRHTAATLYRDLGVGLDTIKDMLGHSSIKITADIYTHSNPTLQRDAAERLGRLLNGGDEPER